MTKLTIGQARTDLADTINRVAFGGERVILRRRGKDVAAIVPLADLAKLEELEDRLDYEAGEKALAGMKARGEKPIPWDVAKRKLRGV